VRELIDIFFARLTSLHGPPQHPARDSAFEISPVAQRILALKRHAAFHHCDFARADVGQFVTQPAF